MNQNERFEQEKEFRAVGQEVDRGKVDFDTISYKQMEDNWEEYIRNHMFNYRSACVKGEIFDKINSYQGKLYCFPVKKGCNIKTGDIALLNQYCEAFAIDDDSIPDEERIMSEIIGTVQLVLNMHNEQDIIFVRDMGIFEFYNSSAPDLAVTTDNICNACYLDGTGCVCMDTLKPFAGQVISVVDNIVTVFVSLEIDDKRKWIWNEDACSSSFNKETEMEV